MFRPARRRALSGLAGLAALPLTALAPSTGADAADGGATCTVAGSVSRKLFVPGDSGFLGRLAPRGAPLTLVATTRGTLAGGMVHGPLVYRVRHGGRDYLNPTLALAPGERVRLTLDNRLDAPTIAHWHGLSVDTANDGNGLTLAAPGERYAYDFEVRDRGALFWYHPHPHGSTGRQMYDGLFGLIDVDDDDHAALRRALDLVPGRTELTLVLADRRHDATYRPTAADMIHGFFGDDAIVNGTSCAYVDVASRLYRLRMLNACNARTLRLARTASGAQVPVHHRRQRCRPAACADRRQGGVLRNCRASDALVDSPRRRWGGPARNAPFRIRCTAKCVQTLRGAGRTCGDGHGSAGGTAASPRPQPRACNGVARRSAAPSARCACASASATIARPSPLAKMPQSTSPARASARLAGYNKALAYNDRVFVMGETKWRATRPKWPLRNYPPPAAARDAPARFPLRSAGA
jgi:suppressor of ftsI/bilirubin oxidase